MVVPGPQAELETLLLDARGRLEEAEDHAGLVFVWSALGYAVANARGRYDDWAAASEQAFRHSRLAGRSGAPPYDFGVALISGSRPADEALEAVELLLTETGMPATQLIRSWLLAMLDRGEEARQAAEEAAARIREQSRTRWAEWHLAEISILAGDHEAASRQLRVLCDWLDATEDNAHLATYLPLLGRSLCVLGRFDEAEQLARRAWGIDEDDPMSRAYACEVLARVHTHRGELAEAERLAREAVAASERTDSLNDQCLAFRDLADVLAAAGRVDEAAVALEQALDRCRRKKNLALARQVRGRLAELRAETQPAV
jgi:tetratricopeptide (TPR) repeat protein